MTPLRSAADGNFTVAGRPVGEVRTRPLLVLAVTSVWLMLILVFRTSISADERLAGAVAVTAGLGAVMGTVIASPRGRSYISVGSLYAALLLLFHAGLILFVVLDLPISFFNPEDAVWFASPALGPAAVSVAVGCMSFVSCYALVQCVGKSRSRSASGPKRDSDPSYGVVGVSLLLVGTLLFYWSAWTSGAPLLGASYGEFLAATREAGLLATSYLLVGFGAAVTAASRTPVWRVAGLVVFSLFAGPAILIGLRGEVILPAAAGLAVAARRYDIRPRLLHGLLLICALSIGSVIRELRQEGIGASNIFHFSFSPLNGLAEMGYSLRPVMQVHVWRDFAREPHLGLSSYLDPLDRLVGGNLLGLDVAAAEVDPRAFLPVIARRVGPIGGSSIGEAYYAAGTVGIVVALGLLGMVVALLDRLPVKAAWDVVVGMVAVILFLWIRNDSTAVAGQVAIAAGALLAIWLCRLLFGSQALAGAPDG